jgi:hypothetical protein
MMIAAIRTEGLTKDFDDTYTSEVTGIDDAGVSAFTGQASRRRRRRCHR